MMFTPPSDHPTKQTTIHTSMHIAKQTSTPSQDINTTIENSLLFGPFFSASAAICNHSLTIVRVYGLQTLEAWFGCLEPLLPTFTPSELVSVVMPKLRMLSSLLVGTWSHPSKTVNHMVSTHPINTPYRYTPSMLLSYPLFQYSLSIHPVNVLILPNISTPPLLPRLSPLTPHPHPASFTLDSMCTLVSVRSPLSIND